MDRDNTLIIGALVAVAAVVLGVVNLGSGSGRSSNGGGGTGTGSTPDLGGGGSGDGGSTAGLVSSIVTSTPIPDGTVQMDPIANPVNAVTDGAVWQGPDPLDLAPGEEGRGDMIAPFNPGNIVAGGPVYTGPDPFNLGGD